LINEIGGRCIAELLVHADLVELIVKCMGLPQIVRITELPNEIGGSQEHALSIIWIIWLNTRRKPRELERTGDPGCVKNVAFSKAIHYKQFGSVDVIRHKSRVG